MHRFGFGSKWRYRGTHPKRGLQREPHADQFAAWRVDWRAVCRKGEADVTEARRIHSVADDHGGKLLKQRGHGRTVGVGGALGCGAGGSRGGGGVDNGVGDGGGGDGSL